jgi:uncharacterized protein YciI
MKAVYAYFMKGDPERVRSVAPAHSAYWRGMGLPGYEGGPFADRSGGLITFECASLDEAERLVAEDPFVLADLVDPRWLKDWRPTPP